jgi:hypothetical protein
MTALPIGTRVQLSTGKPRPTRGKWVIAEWMVVNGQGTVAEVTPSYMVVRIDTRADGSQQFLHRSQVIAHDAMHITVTPLPDPDIVQRNREAIASKALSRSILARAHREGEK